MKKIFLLRHGKSSWEEPGLNDIDRPLNESGIKASKKMGEFFQENYSNVDLVYCSSAKRTLETFNYFQSSFKKRLNVEFTDKLYLASSNDIIDLIAGTDDKYKSVLVIGHNPGIMEVTEDLIGRIFEYPKFSTAALAVIETRFKKWTDSITGSGELVLYKKPKDL